MKVKTIITFSILFSLLLLACGSPKYGCPNNFSSTEINTSNYSETFMIEEDQSTCKSFSKDVQLTSTKSPTEF